MLTDKFLNQPINNSVPSTQYTPDRVNNDSFNKIAVSGCGCIIFINLAIWAFVYYWKHPI